MDTLSEKEVRYLASAANVMHKELQRYEEHGRLARPPKGSHECLGVAVRAGCRALTDFIGDFNRTQEVRSLANADEEKTKAVLNELKGNLDPFFDAERQVLTKAGMEQDAVNELIDWCSKVVEDVRTARLQAVEFLFALGVLQYEACRIAAQNFSVEWAEEPHEVMQIHRPTARTLKQILKGLGGVLIFASNTALPVAAALHPMSLPAALTLAHFCEGSKILGQAIATLAYMDLKGAAHAGEHGVEHA